NYEELGRVLQNTPNQPFHLQRISLAQKRATHPSKDDDFGVRPECPLKDKPEPKSSILPIF
ncbi:penicillin-binding protein, partial [Pseudomonas syringae pv. tagetis]